MGLVTDGEAISCYLPSESTAEINVVLKFGGNSQGAVLGEKSYLCLYAILENEIDRYNLEIPVLLFNFFDRLDVTDGVKKEILGFHKGTAEEIKHSIDPLHFRWNGQPNIEKRLRDNCVNKLVETDKGNESRLVKRLGTVWNEVDQRCDRNDGSHF